MDLVLEVCDSYVFDSLYANLFPVPASKQWSDGWPVGLWNGGGAWNDSSTGYFSRLGAIGGKPREVYGHRPYLFEMGDLAHQSLLPRYNVIRQSVSLFILVTIFGWLLYLGVATFSYVFIFDKSVFNHPRYLKNQMAMELKQALSAIPHMALLTIPWFLLELHGFSHLYMGIDYANYGLHYLVLECFTFILFTDFGVYLLHRWLHWPSVYKLLHKKHHKWLVCTPYASHAFHPVDGYIQSLPYHMYPFLFPLHKVLYLILFTFVNLWTVMIHGSEFLTNDPVINGVACHTVHHLYFNYNYGQFTTLCDRLGGSFRQPDKELFDPKLKKDRSVWEKQLQEVDRMIEMVDGVGDDRVYE
ncbi:C-5 sterol desaturase Ecym_1501 [Eremothecium cymbalariae DBVPG|uniref:Fatty acid hydroxylase domain-containing protein n=1 Tax=Eremothecium cymbalariae (strain CBS 270.75 / DBVPG 7215 / KCTC 17166 / NRRL Y-17582) TaxID=931890 RepID=G8JMR0_ERECY|nr:hypothetical protein Ecym_1501 [Eremothecium cymbalariae DBVPG\